MVDSVRLRAIKDLVNKGCSFRGRLAPMFNNNLKTSLGLLRDDARHLFQYQAYPLGFVRFNPLSYRRDNPGRSAAQ